MSPDQVKPALHQMVRDHAGAGAVAAFDWDDTCTVGDIGLTCLATLDAENGTHVLPRYRWLCENHSKHVGYRYCTTTHAGRTDADLRALAGRVWQAATADGRIRPRHWIRALMQDMKEHDWQVWIVTANPRPIVQTAAATYGIPPQRVIGMELKTGPDGRLIPVLEEPAPYLEQKVPALMAAVGQKPLFAASDSMSDVALLESAQHSLALPAWNDGLREHASNRGWWTVDDR